MAVIAKLKARDIIPGWPRGHSTTISAINLRWQWDDFTMFWCHKPFLQGDISRDREYHLDQQRMFDWYVSRYRVPPGKFIVDSRGHEINCILIGSPFHLAGVE